MNKLRIILAVKMARVGLSASVCLALLSIGVSQENADVMPSKLTALIKDIANMRELEATTFHVINITEHDSVLPAELRLAGKESDWADGVVGYVDGKAVPTGLLPGDDHVLLLVNVPLKSKEAKKVTFKKGKGAATSGLKVEEEGNRLIISNKRAKWKLGPDGMEQFQVSGKTFAMKETGIANGALKTTVTPVACRVSLRVEGKPVVREYLFYPDSSLWQVRTGIGDVFKVGSNYQMKVNGSNAFYYSHLCTAFFGDPGSPYGAVIETGELEKGKPPSSPGPKQFLLFSGTDWGLLMDNTLGLGIYPNPSSSTILVDATKRKEGVFIKAVPLDEQSNIIFQKWHWGCNSDRLCGCGEWRTQPKPLGEIVSYVFGAITDVKEGPVQRSESLPPILLRHLDNNLQGAQVPWATADKSQTIRVEDLDGNGPDMLNDRWSWCDNTRVMSSFEFNDPDKDGLLDVVYISVNRNDKGDKLDTNERKPPMCALRDQTHDGKIVANCVFFGGRIDQDWIEYGSGDPFGGGKSDQPLKPREFKRISRALDLDNDGDVDVIENRDAIEPETDYNHRHGRGIHHLDTYDNNPFHGVLLDPLAGNCRVSVGFHWPMYVGRLSVSGWRVQGVLVGGQDAVNANIDLTGDGLPNAKVMYDGGLYGEDYVMRPVMNRIACSLYLQNRPALKKINSWVWQEGYGSSACFVPDVGVFHIRKNSTWPWTTNRDKYPGSKQMPKKQLKDSIVTYRDKHGNEIRFAGIGLPGDEWKGDLLAGSKHTMLVKDWSDSLHYDWDYLLACFEGIFGLGTESGYPGHFLRWEFCADYAQRRESKVFYSELDGRLHLKGASWGHYTPYQHVHPKKAPLDDVGKADRSDWLHDGYFILDCDFMRYYVNYHEVFFDEDGDGYLDCFLVDADNDGWYEDRAWYDKTGHTVFCMKEGILVLWPHQLEPYPEEELLIDAETYSRLVALKKMSEERTSVLKSTSVNIKAQSPIITIAETNLWMGVSAELLPQVLLDACHTDAGIWRDLSPKGYSRLLTGLQRQKVVVRELSEKWSDESLRDASVLFVASPHTTKPETDEMKALDAFLKRGGRVVVIFPDWSVEPVEKTEAPNTALTTEPTIVADSGTDKKKGKRTGGMVDSPLDTICASYGINRNNERIELVPAMDPQFKQREAQSEVSARFNGDQSTGIMKNVRKLYFNGSSLSVSNAAAPLVRYQDKIIAAKAKVGKGELLVLCSEMMLNNGYACFQSFKEGGLGAGEVMPLDIRLDVKPDNNVFMDNLARYLVADQIRFKVLKSGDAQMNVELAGPGKVYVNKGTKVTPGGGETINGKENGDTMCFEVPASKALIKLDISR